MQFWDNFSEETEVIVDGTTPRAFRTMLNLVYRQGTDLTNLNNCSHLFEVLQLVDRYQMSVFREWASQAIYSHEVTTKKFFKLFNLAEEFLQYRTFWKVCQQLRTYEV